MSNILAFAKRNLHESLKTAKLLFKVMIPVLIAVEALKYFNLVSEVSELFAPIMQLVDLPPEAGLIWATACLVNIYSALIVWFELSQYLGLTQAQATILSLMILVAHSLPMESALSFRLGINAWFITLFRMISAILCGALFLWLCGLFSLFEQPSSFLTTLTPPASGIIENLVANVFMLIKVFFIILALVAVMDVFRISGIETLIGKVVTPVMKLMGMSAKATQFCIIGLLLGLSFGGGLLIREQEKAHLSLHDLLGVIVFLSLCHSIIQDSLLLIIAGADALSLILYRFVFSFLVTMAFLSACMSVPRILYLNKRGKEAYVNENL